MRTSVLTGILLLSGIANAQESQNETTLLTNEPAIEVGGVVDVLGEYVETDRPFEDGFNFEGRTFEVSLDGRFSPRSRFYATGLYEDRDLDLAEAAFVLGGLGGNGSLSLGRTALDFGKQMQLHRHELRTVERPLALRTFIGDWSWGDGARYDNWFAAGDQTAVRFSLGVFGRVGAEGEESKDPRVAPFLEDSREPDSPAFNARLTGYTNVTPTSQFQVGASYRSVPDFTFDFEPSGGKVEGLNSGLLGIDATLGWTDLTGTRSWTVGGELLWFNGDIGTALDIDATPLDLTDDTFTVLTDDTIGFYVFGDYGADEYNSFGFQYSWVEEPASNGPELGEFDLYYTRYLNALTPTDRLRFGATLAHHDTLDESVRFVVQYTVGIGAHPSQSNW